MKKVQCTSCRTELTNFQGSTSFKCPQCGEAEIVRCHKCRELATKYTCSKCGFEGPN